MLLEGDSPRQPSAVAKELQRQYEEILVDEYQDSNLVQETLIGEHFKRRNGPSQRVYGRRCKAEHLPLPSGETGAFMEKYASYTREKSPSPDD